MLTIGILASAFGLGGASIYVAVKTLPAEDFDTQLAGFVASLALLLLAFFQCFLTGWVAN